MRIKLEDFQAGYWRTQFQYKSFLPSFINHEWVWEDGEINVLLEKATRSLSELNAYTQIVPDVDLFIKMHVAKEANTSSKIEGTKTEMDDIVLPKSVVLPEKHDDWQEVRNYVHAMEQAIDELDRLPLSIRLIKSIHATLLSGVRGEHKQPGEIRESQNWIGGSNPGNAHFVPPHQDDLAELLSDLEKFWHNETIFVPHLIKCAITHYQFETIHPFCDGNGRIGRLLIPLYLISFKILDKPSLYMSAYLEKNRNEYYEALDNVRGQNDLLGWCKFFLNMLTQTAEGGKQTFQKIKLLNDEMTNLAMGMQKRGSNALTLIKYLYEHPIVSIRDVSNKLNITYPPANQLVQDLVEKSVLAPYQKQSNAQLYIFSKYMDIFANNIQ